MIDNGDGPNVGRPLQMLKCHPVAVSKKILQSHKYHHNEVLYVLREARYHPHKVLNFLTDQSHKKL